MKRILLSLLFAAVLVSPMAAGNLVVNPGFETGDLTGWTFVPASGGSEYTIAQSSVDGSYSFNFAAMDIGDYDTIGQGVPTTPGMPYTFSFDMDTESNGPLDQQVWWDGMQVLEIYNATPWTHYSFNVTATNPSTTITFMGYNLQSFNRLDNVSVIDPPSVPEPATCLAVGGILATLLLRRRR